jgi:hypothetical protein
MIVILEKLRKAFYLDYLYKKGNSRSKSKSKNKNKKKKKKQEGRKRKIHAVLSLFKLY